MCFISILCGKLFRIYSCFNLGCLVKCVSICDSIDRLYVEYSSISFW